MTLRQMQYFESVARTHNLTKSAQELFISQPSLSVSMKTLEQEVKVSLFQRDGTHIKLTDAGQTLAIEINSVLKQYEKMQQIIRSGNLERNYVRFGFSTLVGDFSAPLICRKFLDTEFRTQPSPETGTAPVGCCAYRPKIFGKLRLVREI